MYWRMSVEPFEPTPDPRPFDGRFVLHRHRDEDGPHLDLRLEQDGYLMGWRIDAHSLDDNPWAVEKAPHPLAWLERDGEAVREDEGWYWWLERKRDRRVVLLRGIDGDRAVRLVREPGLPPRVASELLAALKAVDARPEDDARLVADGLTARRRALERLCGLGRELDGEAFDETFWRRTAAGLTLDELHGQLRAYEVRFDLKYPPQPASRPEPLPDETDGTRRDAVLTILRE
jgi:hypothetical protein